jgi:putative holliday junction resolvase
MPRAVGIDLGSRRIGVAVSDPTGTLASPLTTIERGRSHADDHARIVAAVTETGASCVVVGLPLSLDGSRGPAARLVEAEVAELTDAVPVPVELYDERLTSVSAHRNLRSSALSGREKRGVVDQEAAAVLLQAWLDGPGRDEKRG